MRKVVFFPGIGTVYSRDEREKKQIELYPDTIFALRFLSKRDYDLVLLTSGYYEFKSFRAALKDKTLQLENLNLEKSDLRSFFLDRHLAAEECFFITDGRYLQYFLQSNVRIVLILSGQGLCTLSDLSNQDNKYQMDVCKNFYAAALSAALNN